MAEENSLTEAEKDRIRLEELFRFEIRQLEKERENEEKGKNKSWWRNVLPVINSAFFLWFLSSVVVGGISYFYTERQKQRDEEQRVYEQKQTIEREIKKLDAEISNRLSYVNSLIEALDPYLIDPTSVSGFLGLEKPLEAKYPINVFPEYSNRTLQSLLWELSRAVPDDEKLEIDDALNESRKLSSIYMGQHSDSINWKEYMKRVKRSGIQLPPALVSGGRPLNLKALNLDRWGRPLTCLAMPRR